MHNAPMPATWKGKARKHLLVPLLIVLLVVVSLFVASWLFYDPLNIPKTSGDFTARTLYRARHRIADHFAVHGGVPEDLQAFLAADGDIEPLHRNSLNRPFAIGVRADGVTVEIRDLGKDGKVGGSGEDADINAVFRADVPGGEQIEECGPWIEDPLDDVRPWGMPKSAGRWNGA